MIATGISIAGVSSALGVLLGKSNSDVISEKAEFIDLSRRAYDDLSTRYYLIKKFIMQNDSLEARLNRFNVYYQARKADENDSLQAIAQVRAFYQEYEFVLQQIPSLLDEFESMQTQYVMQFPKMKSIFDRIIQDINKVRTRYQEKVLPILDLSADVKKFLGS